MLKFLKIILAFVLIMQIIMQNLFFAVFAEQKIENNKTKSIEKIYKSSLNTKKSLVKSITLEKKEILKSNIEDLKKGEIFIELAKGTIIKNADLKTQIDPSQIGISETKKEEKNKIIKNISEDKLDYNNNFTKNIKVFNFGILDKNLIFSKPIRIIFPVNAKDGENIEIKQKLAGNKDFSANGLSTNPETSCNKGISSKTEKNIISPVKNGLISFYSCSSSSFAVIEKIKKSQLKAIKKIYKAKLTEKKSLVKSINVYGGATLTATGSDFNNQDIVVEIPKGTIIKNKNSEIKIDPSQVGISEAKKEDKEKAVENFTNNKNTEKNKINEESIKTFEFGIQDQPLIFSKPVKITLPANFKDGTSVEILVKHSGDADFGFSGLTLNPDEICNSDGTITNQEKGIFPTIKDSKATFYTCAASSFTMNPSGGTGGSNDLKLVIGDCGQFQLTYSGANNVYSTATIPVNGCNPGIDSRIALRIGNTTYWSESSNWSTNTTNGVQNGNTYTATTTLTRVVSARTYTLILNRKYIAPNKYFTIDYSVNIPAGNPNNVRFYIGNDSTVGGGDVNDVGYYVTTPSNTVGTFDNVLNQVSAIRYLSGAMWTGYEASPYNTIRTRINGGTNFNNTIQATSGDLGFGAYWNYGTGTTGTFTGSLEWRLNPYVAGNVADLVPGVGIPVPNPMQVGVDSTLPVLISNIGNASSTGVHSVVLNFSGTLITGPLTPFTSNGWSCGASSGTTVSCNKTTTIAPLVDDIFYINIVPKPGSAGINTVFNISITNASDSNSSNNSAFSNSISIVNPPAESIPPTITSITPFSGSISPVGVNFTYNYFDTGSQINQVTATGILSKWNSTGSIWTTQTGALTPFSISSGSTTFTSNNITYGKYKFDVTIKDNNGNTSTGSSIFYLDQPEITVSTGSLDIGKLNIGSSNFSSGEITITAKTIGAPFQIIMNKLSPIAEINGNQIIDWNGIIGFGYDKFPYLSTITKINTNEVLGSQSGSINTSGNLNTYTYKVKMGTLISSLEQQGGNYQTNLSFRINLTY